ncbi:hypothetical protein ABZX74_36740 [Streptomyces olivaceoviridis]|uniref:hypothetical protein n=1 Tax=Streptomyces olivaceoviridis TaxID=1921 RepID=UPI0033BD0C52
MDDLEVRLKDLSFPAVAGVGVLSLDVTVAKSNRVHGSYLRFPADVPSGGSSVVLRLRVRRFTCPKASCVRRTFVEQIPWAAAGA